MIGAMAAAVLDLLGIMPVAAAPAAEAGFAAVLAGAAPLAEAVASGEEADAEVVNADEAARGAGEAVSDPAADPPIAWPDAMPIMLAAALPPAPMPAAAATAMAPTLLPAAQQGSATVDRPPLAAATGTGPKAPDLLPFATKPAAGGAPAAAPSETRPETTPQVQDAPALPPASPRHQGLVALVASRAGGGIADSAPVASRATVSEAPAAAVQAAPIDPPVAPRTPQPAMLPGPPRSADPKVSVRAARTARPVHGSRQSLDAAPAPEGAERAMRPIEQAEKAVNAKPAATGPEVSRALPVAASDTGHSAPAMRALRPGPGAAPPEPLGAPPKSAAGAPMPVGAGSPIPPALRPMPRREAPGSGEAAGTAPGDWSAMPGLAATVAAPTAPPEPAAPPAGTAAAAARAPDEQAADIATETLGMVAVGVSGRPEAVHVRLAVDSGGAAQLLSDAGVQLERGLAAGGTRLEGLSVDVRGGSADRGGGQTGLSGQWSQSSHSGQPGQSGQSGQPLHGARPGQPSAELPPARRPGRDRYA